MGAYQRSQLGALSGELRGQLMLIGYVERVVEAVGRLALGALAPGPRCVAGAAVHPGRELGVAPEVGHSLPGPDEGFLRHVGGKVPVP